MWWVQRQGLETANLSQGMLFKWDFWLTLPFLFSHCTMLLTLPCTTSVSHLSPSWLTASWSSTSTSTHWPQIHSCTCKSQGAGWASVHFKLCWCRTQSIGAVWAGVPALWEEQGSCGTAERLFISPVLCVRAEQCPMYCLFLFMLFNGIWSSKLHFCLCKEKTNCRWNS